MPWLGQFLKFQQVSRMFPLLTIPLPCFHTFMIKYIQSQAAIIIYPMPFKKLMFSLPLVCLSTSILHITAKIIFPKNLSELGLSLQTLECYPQPFLEKTTWTLRSSTIWAQSTMLVFSLLSIHRYTSFFKYFFYT